MKSRESLSDILHTSSGKKLLLLGKGGIFDQKEIERFLKNYKITLDDQITQNTAIVVESKKLNPVEEMISEQAYDAEIPSYGLEELEELISQDIDDESLLMAIKLGNDQSRLIRMLSNPHISNELFVRLLRLYRWDREEEDSREDRDVIMYILRRYIKIKPTEEDLLYSYLTLRRLATETADSELLDVLVGCHNFEFTVRGRERVTLRETIARNPNISTQTVSKLLSFRDKNIDASLAGNLSVSLDTLKELSQKDDHKLLLSLAVNSSIDDNIFAALLEKGTAVAELLLFRQPISKERYAILTNTSPSAELLSVVAANNQTDDRVLKILFDMGDTDIWQHLAANPAVSVPMLQKLYEKEIKGIDKSLAANRNTPTEILSDIYSRYSSDIEILSALASNPALSEDIIKALYSMDNFEINRGLARNSSLLMDMLDALKLDSRLQNDLAQNQRLIDSYEEILNQNKAMMNL